MALSPLAMAMMTAQAAPQLGASPQAGGAPQTGGLPSLSQLSQPPSPPRNQVNPTDYQAAFNLATDTAEKNYQAKLAQQNATWGGLAGLGGAGLLALPNMYKSGMLSGLFSGGGTPAANTAISLGTPIADASGAMTGIQGIGPVAAATDAAGGAGGAGAGLAGLGGVGGELAADTAATGLADAGAAGAAGAGFSLADILPFLFGL